jgi:hypothetical protein
MASELLFPIKKPEFYFIENSGFFAMSYQLRATSFFASQPFAMSYQL